MSPRTLAVVGVGSVGVAAAYACVLSRTAERVLLVDRDHALAEGHALDLAHGQALLGRVDVRAARFEELADAGVGVVVVAAGRSQKKGESRLDLLRGNADVVRDVMGHLDRHAPEAVVIVATNPVDVLARVAVGASSRPAAKIVGSGTALDSARFRAAIGRELGVSPRSVHGMVLGEHGDSQVPVWSGARVGGISVALDAEARARVAAETRDAAKAIIQRKGRTDLAIGAVLAHLARVVLVDERSVHPLSVPLAGEYGLDGVSLGLPVVLGREGVVARLVPELDAEELAALRASAEVLRRAEAG